MQNAGLTLCQCSFSISFAFHVCITVNQIHVAKELYTLCMYKFWLAWEKKKRKKKYVFRHREKNEKKAFFGVRWCDEFWCFDMLKESVMLAGNANILYYRRGNTRSVAVLCSFIHCNCDMRWCFYWNRVRVGRYPFLSHNLDSRFVSQQPKRELVFVLDWVAFFPCSLFFLCTNTNDFFRSFKTRKK